MSDNAIEQYEKHLKRLESIVREMENGELSLEASLKAYEEGIALVRQCQQALNEAEQKISILSQQKDGTETLAPFDAETGASKSKPTLATLDSNKVAPKPIIIANKPPKPSPNCPIKAHISQPYSTP